MRTIGIRDLKAQLSRVLREVRQGEVYLVTDRGRVIAEMREPSTDAARALSAAEQGLLRLSATGELRIAERPRQQYRAPTLSMPDGTASAWLNWTRDDA